MNRTMTLLGVAAFVSVFLSSCSSDRDCDCVERAEPAESLPAAAKTPPVMNAPNIAGKWKGRWDSVGHKGHGGGLVCTAKQTGPAKWEAVFTAEYGQTKSYDVKLDGTLAAGLVSFGGKVDLGAQDGGVFTWSGRASASEFNGKYEGGGDTGTFTMSKEK